MQNERTLPPGRHLPPSLAPPHLQQIPKEALLNNESRAPLVWSAQQNRKEIMNTFAGRTCFAGTRRRRSVETKQGATFVSWPLPSNAIPVSKSLRVPETTRLCRGLYDSNYIICPICYCFIHVRIICFGFLCNVWGFVCAPWETCDTVSALDRLFIKCPLFCQVDFPTMMHR